MVKSRKCSLNLRGFLKKVPGMVIAFLKWILTDGQKFVGEAGYVTLPEDKIKSELSKI